jgi:hypothetical protein
MCFALIGSPRSISTDGAHPHVAIRGPRTSSSPGVDCPDLDPTRIESCSVLVAERVDQPPDPVGTVLGPQIPGLLLGDRGDSSFKKMVGETGGGGLGCAGFGGAWAVSWAVRAPRAHRSLHAVCAHRLLGVGREGGELRVSPDGLASWRSRSVKASMISGAS